VLRSIGVLYSAAVWTMTTTGAVVPRPRLRDRRAGKEITCVYLAAVRYIATLPVKGFRLFYANREEEGVDIASASLGGSGKVQGGGDVCLVTWDGIVFSPAPLLSGWK